jgi:hypothetical protein
MSLPDFQIDVASIVLIGRFAPSSITPASLAGEGLLGRDEALSSLSPTLTPNFSIFDASWLHAEITENRLLLSTTDSAEAIRLCDLAVGILSLSPPQPISAVGLNRNVHFQVASSAEWHSIGDRLLPKEPWKGTLDLPGTRSAVIQGVRQDDFLGHIQVTVEPSFRMPPGAFGVFVEHNDHYFLRQTESKPKSRDDILDPAMQDLSSTEPSIDLIPVAKKIISSQWAASMRRAESIIENIWNMRTGR